MESGVEDEGGVEGGRWRVGAGVPNRTAPKSMSPR